jgi:hypothetical protein
MVMQIYLLQLAKQTESLENDLLSAEAEPYQIEI